jgi:hypothetical protein
MVEWGTDTSLGYGSAMIKLRRLLVFTKAIVVFFEVGMGMILVFTRSGGGLLSWI